MIPNGFFGDDGTHLIARLPSQGSSRIMSIGINGTAFVGRDEIDERSCARDPIYSSIISQVIQKPERNILLCVCCCCDVKIATIRAFVFVVVVTEAIILIAMMTNDWGQWQAVKNADGASRQGRQCRPGKRHQGRHAKDPMVP
jgi:hypothetical protein